MFDGWELIVMRPRADGAAEYPGDHD